MEYLFVGLGGTFGAITRYGINRWTGQRWSKDFPLATFIINLTGSFALGFLYIYFSTRPNLLFIKDLTTIGFLGAYTTYSTFSFEIINLLEDKDTKVAITYFSLSIVLGLILAFFGMSLAQYLLGVL